VFCIAKSLVAGFPVQEPSALPKAYNKRLIKIQDK
jgi:hypothetical protein